MMVEIENKLVLLGTERECLRRALVTGSSLSTNWRTLVLSFGFALGFRLEVCSFEVGGKENGIFYE
jgi:hypothetical protein